MKITKEVGFFRQEQVVEISSVIKVNVDDLVNLVFGSGLYTLPWWGGIGFRDANGIVSWDDVDEGKYDANTLAFAVEAWVENGLDENDPQFSWHDISLSKLVSVIGANPEFATAIANEEMDVVSADNLLQVAVYGKLVWG